MPGVTGGDHANAFAADKAFVGLHADTHAVFLAETDHFGLLDKVHAQGIGGAGVAPGHSVMTGHATTALHGRAQHRVAGVLAAIQVRNLFGYLLGVQ